MIPIPEEKKLGFGLITLFLCLRGLMQARKSPWVPATIVAFAFIFVITTWWPYNIILWKPWFWHFPFAQGIRSLSRIGLLFLLPAAFGLATFLQARSKWRWLWPVVFLVVLEQGRSMPSYVKEDVRARVEKVKEGIHDAIGDTGDCLGFLLVAEAPPSGDAGLNTYDIQRDAIWASTEIGLPTVNGYFTKAPKFWSFDPVLMKSKDDLPRLEKKLKQWAADHDLSREDFCLVVTKL